MSLASLSARVVACRRCPRLVAHCRKIAREKRRAYRDEIYWETTDVGLGAFGSTGIESNGGTFNNWFDNAQHHAFYLTGVPEPSSVVLAGLGLAALAGCVWRRRATARRAA